MLFCRNQRLRKKLKENFGAAPDSYEKERMLSRIDRIRIYHDEAVHNGTGNTDIQKKERDRDCKNNSDNYRYETIGIVNQYIDDITWNDLEMDQVFISMNHTNSYVGEQLLYHCLHTIDADTDWNAFERRIAFFRRDPEKRVELQEALAAIGKRDDSYSLPYFLMHSELWRIQSGWLLRLLQLCLLVFAAGALITQNPFFTAGLVIIVCVNLAIYMYTKQRYEAFLFSLSSLKQLLQFCQSAVSEKFRSDLNVSEDIVRISGGLKKLTKKIVGWQGRKYGAMAGDLASLLQDYLFGVTLLDISSFNRIIKIIDGRQAEILKLYEFAGMIDASVSIASYRESIPCSCLPQIGADGFQIQGMVHPLLSDAVPNDFELNRRALITGANASGKSTFMKALAINAILAQTIHTCTAEKFSMPSVSVITSMALRDDVMTGESYYVREARRIREMVCADDPAHPLLIVIDEILKGTNTHERLAASQAILSYLVKLPHYVIVATHDMELIRELHPAYHTFYFESRVTDDDIIFPYLIRKGNGGNSNAIALLSLLDYPKEIITTAKRKVAQTYENR